jgi:glucose/arabinose dehydrogenase
VRLLAPTLALALLLPAAAPEAGPVRGSKPQQVEDVYLPEPEVRVETWVEGLEAPWSLVFLGDGRALVSERPGRIRLIRDGRLLPEPWAELDATAGGAPGLLGSLLDLAITGEGGLMGLAVHPAFDEEPHVYVMYTTRGEAGVVNRVARLRDEGDRGVLDRVIVDGIPGARLHNGGRIAFGPDGMLYVTTGEIFQAELAGDPGSPNGKILRLDPGGRVPADNPFPGSPVWSYGHRNAQGLAWHPDTGDLFAPEHGPSGEFGVRAYDEINVVEPGGHHGWPEVVGAPGIEPYVDPLIAWRERATPPGGATFHRGDLWVATLRSEALLRIGVVPEGPGYRVTMIERWFAEGPESGRFGRLRDVVEGPDGALYVLTSNRDGRGTPRAGDDRILRLTPRVPALD